jgi:BirA family biotin operon repressor/biotin-[acetyl-CoA-carboxylase] ligase
MVAGQRHARPPEAAAGLLLPSRVTGAMGEARIGATVHHETSVDSTNRLARELGRQGAMDGLVVLAEEQSAGRGRRRRNWVSPAGKGIYLSVLLRPEATPAEAGAAAQLVAGIAVAESLAAHTGRTLMLRWPNDCYLCDRKMAGVLVESEITGGTLDFLVCGVGVNVNHEESDFPPDLRARVTSLRMLSGHSQPRLPVLVSFLQALEYWDDVGRKHGLSPVIERWLELSPESRGSYVEIQTDKGLMRGIAAGLSPTGGLYVEDEQENRHEITVGELVRLSPYTSEAQRRLP